MALIIQKFGGTSVGDIERIRHVATRVQAEIEAGNQVAVVVSAMSGVTNQLVGYVEAVSDLSEEAHNVEYDAVVSSGEQVTAGLLALTLQSMGLSAHSWSGHQMPLKTEGLHSKARIADIDVEKMHAALKRGEIIVMPGFQGIAPSGKVATLGRGGSDTSAVALAAALKADRCDIYTDVSGIYTTDPRLVEKARKLNKIGYEEVLEMASLGAKVLQTRSVELAMKYQVPVQVRSTFEETPGTLLVDEEEVMERRVITGIAYSKNDAQITLLNVKHVPGVAANVFGPLAEAEINVDMIVQNISEDGQYTDMTFTMPKTDVTRAQKELESADIEYEALRVDEDVAKVSVIGVGMRSHAGVAQKMFATLAEKGINIGVISTSEIKISVLIEAEYLELALRSLHTAYGLDAA